jgi:hypothetical protein
MSAPSQAYFSQQQQQQLQQQQQPSPQKNQQNNDQNEFFDWTNNLQKNEFNSFFDNFNQNNSSKQKSVLKNHLYTHPERLHYDKNDQLDAIKLLSLRNDHNGDGSEGENPEDIIYEIDKQTQEMLANQLEIIGDDEDDQHDELNGADIIGEGQNGQILAQEKIGEGQNGNQIVPDRLTDNQWRKLVINFLQDGKEQHNNVKYMDFSAEKSNSTQNLQNLQTFTLDPLSSLKLSPSDPSVITRDVINALVKDTRAHFDEMKKLQYEKDNELIFDENEYSRELNQVLIDNELRQSNHTPEVVLQVKAKVEGDLGALLGVPKFDGGDGDVGSGLSTDVDNVPRDVSYSNNIENGMDLGLDKLKQGMSNIPLGPAGSAFSDQQVAILNQIRHTLRVGFHKMFLPGVNFKPGSSLASYLIYDQYLHISNKVKGNIDRLIANRRASLELHFDLCHDLIKFPISTPFDEKLAEEVEKVKKNEKFNGEILLTLGKNPQNEKDAIKQTREALKSSKKYQHFYKEEHFPMKSRPSLDDIDMNDDDDIDMNDDDDGDGDGVGDNDGEIELLRVLREEKEKREKKRQKRAGLIGKETIPLYNDDDSDYDVEMVTDGIDKELIRDFIEPFFPDGNQNEDERLQRKEKRAKQIAENAAKNYLFEDLSTSSCDEISKKREEYVQKHINGYIPTDAEILSSFKTEHELHLFVEMMEKHFFDQNWNLKSWVAQKYDPDYEDIGLKNDDSFDQGCNFDPDAVLRGHINNSLDKNGETSISTTTTSVKGASNVVDVNSEASALEQKQDASLTSLTSLTSLDSQTASLSQKQAKLSGNSKIYEDSLLLVPDDDEIESIPNDLVSSFEELYHKNNQNDSKMEMENNEKNFGTDSPNTPTRPLLSTSGSDSSVITIDSTNDIDFEALFDRLQAENDIKNDREKIQQNNEVFSEIQFTTVYDEFNHLLDSTVIKFDREYDNEFKFTHDIGEVGSKLAEKTAQKSQFDADIHDDIDIMNNNLDEPNDDDDSDDDDDNNNNNNNNNDILEISLPIELNSEFMDDYRRAYESNLLPIDHLINSEYPAPFDYYRFGEIAKNDGALQRKFVAVAERYSSLSLSQMIELSVGYELESGDNNNPNNSHNSHNSHNSSDGKGNAGEDIDITDVAGKFDRLFAQKLSQDHQERLEKAFTGITLDDVKRLTAVFDLKPNELGTLIADSLGNNEHEYINLHFENQRSLAVDLINQFQSDLNYGNK